MGRVGWGSRDYARGQRTRLSTRQIEDYISGKLVRETAEERVTQAVSRWLVEEIDIHEGVGTGVEAVLPARLGGRQIVEQGRLADSTVPGDRSGLELRISEPCEDPLDLSLPSEEPPRIPYGISERKRVLYQSSSSDRDSVSLGRCF
jgi:hypothetical protein